MLTEKRWKASSKVFGTQEISSYFDNNVSQIVAIMVSNG